MPIESLPAGVLSDKIIREAIAGSPALISNHIENSIQACSYDLRVGTVFLDGKILKWATSEQQQITIQPGGIISLFTHEELNLPSCVMATAFPMNVWSSQGLLVLNPGHIDPGYKGPLTVRLINIRSTPKNINFGDPIFTVIFEKLPEAVTKPYSKKNEREQRERDYNSLDVEQNPGGLGPLIMRGKNPPFLSTEQINTAIREYWVTRVIFWATIIAAVTGTIAVIQSFRNDSKTSISSESEKALPISADQHKH